MQNLAANVLDEAIESISPRWALNRAKSRAMLNLVKGETHHDGASTTRRSMRGYALRDSSHPDDEILPELEILRERSRDLYRNNPIARGAIDTISIHAVGSGLSPQLRIDREALGLSDEEADKIEEQIEKRFKIWAESREADAGRRLDFFEMQQLAFRSFLQSGEVLALLPVIERAGSTSDLRVQLIEADRLSNPNGKADDEQVAGGIEVGRYGEPIAYHIETTPPGLLNRFRRKWQRVLAFGNVSGRQNVIHLYKQDRPGQRRGIPFLTAAMKFLKNLDRYIESELLAAVLSANFTVFVKKEMPDTSPLDGALNRVATGIGNQEEDKGPLPDLGPGSVVELLPGEDIDIANPGRPNSQFDAFTSSMIRLIGVALGIPYEILLSYFSASYSASRGAYLLFSKKIQPQREFFASGFCQPIFEEWMAWEVISGRIEAPGFFSDPLIRKAWTTCEWVGPSEGQIDPVKDTQAAILRVASGFRTMSEETERTFGGNWMRNMLQIAKERRILKGLGLNLQFSKASMMIEDASDVEEPADPVEPPDEEQQTEQQPPAEKKNGGRHV